LFQADLYKEIVKDQPTLTCLKKDKLVFRMFWKFWNVYGTSSLFTSLFP